MAGIKVVRMGGTPHRWLKLVTWMYTGEPAGYNIMFTDKKAADEAAHRIRNILDHHPKMPMLVAQRGCEVYVMKNLYVQKVVIRDELP